jgi:hypothetical protein
MQQSVTPRTELTTITPAMATKWLATTKRNRSLSPTTVKAYAADMRAGAWKITHQGIGFDVDGALVDGQHRLNAVIEADIPVTMPVTHGLPRDAQDVIDAPRVRTVKDQLELIDGVTNALGKAAVCKIVYALETGARGAPKLTLHQTRELLARDAERMDRVYSICWKTPLTAAPFVAAITFGLGAGEKVFEFAEMVRNGEGLKKGDPAHTLRELLLMGRQFAGGFQDRMGVAFCVLRAAHAHLHGERLNILRPTQLMSGPLMEEILSFFRLANETARGSGR